MEKKELMDIVEQSDFQKVAVIEVEQLVFQPEFRVYCEENLCGNYNANYACPPYCGTPKEMEQKVRQYKLAIVFQSITSVTDVYKEEETKAAKKAHMKKTKEAIQRLNAKGIYGHPIMAGPCSECEECNQRKDKPCPHVDTMFSCLSAYCIDASKLAEICDMVYWCGEGRVALFSLFLIK